MDDLPLIPAKKIIDYLLIEDVLNLKLVNKWFYQFINGNVRIKDLVMTTHDLSPNRRWFYTYDLINLQNLLEYDLDVNVYLNLNQPILGQLKQLCIFNTRIILETLNSLDRLAHLEIVNSEIKSITENNVLSLPMLEILNLDLNWSKNHNNLIIDSTKLRAIKLYQTGVSFIHSENITYLEVDYYYKNCEIILPSCINLQHFYCRDLNNFNEFNLIKNLPKLKSIHFDGPEETFDSLINEKKRLNKDLEIHFFNFKFDELPDDLPDEMGAEGFDGYIDELPEDHLHSYYAKYYSRLADHCPFVKSINYNLLERYFNQIPQNFMKRFVNLTNFNVSWKINNRHQLIRVLGECKTITWLALHSSLGQHFFDIYLYNLCPNISVLEVCGPKFVDEKLLDCEFILKFKNIRQLSVYQPAEDIKFVNVKFNYSHNRDLFKITIWTNKDGTYKPFLSKESEDPLVLKSLESYLDLI